MGERRASRRGGRRRHRRRHRRSLPRCAPRRYGLSVAVAEAHYVAGGAAHGFVRDGFHFDAGPSYFLGLSSPPGESINGVRQVMDAVGESLPDGVAVYNSLKMYFPEGKFECVANRKTYRNAIARFAGDEAVAEWDALENAMSGLGDAAVAIPFAGMRADAGVALTMAKYVPPLFKALGNGPRGAEGFEDAKYLRENFSVLVDEHVKNPWLRGLLDLECFVISGLKADATSAAIMAFTYAERHKEEGCVYDYPIGGSMAIVDALARGVRKHGGKLALRSPVDQIVLDDEGKACGVRLRRGGRVVRARRAVVTNASAWDTVSALLPESALSRRRENGDETHTETTPKCGSFVHLHVGFDATGLPADEELGIHHLVVDDWRKGVDGKRNVFNISIPTTLDPTAAPEGKHVAHVYGAANEPWGDWSNVKYGSDEWADEKRGWRRRTDAGAGHADIRSRVECELVATPLTQRRFVKKVEGTYGPGVDMTRFNVYGADLPPGPTTGVPASTPRATPRTRASGFRGGWIGFFTANSIVSVWQHVGMVLGLGWDKIGKNV